MHTNQIVQRAFYHRNTLTVARNLLGCVLVRQRGRTVIRARIVETEAYIGETDLACHASKGRTKRTEVMYGAAGHAYVYLVYGMHHCLNIVTERLDYPAAVLIRAVTIENVSIQKTNGPGKLCRWLEVDRCLNSRDVTLGEKLWVERPSHRVRRSEVISVGPRIGIDYAAHCRANPWRFILTSKTAEKLLK